MANRSKVGTQKSPAVSLAIAAKGISTGRDFANFMSALMGDLISGRVAPNIGHATCNAAGKLLKVVEMQQKYGTNTPEGKVLELAMNTPLVGGESGIGKAN